ncbi:MAG: SpoIIE family protein phosphatase [Chloroflexota bacterium]|jgi:serine phosphatase RsbU (regulator of sigma subunit)|nr:SpoIIE family protein phosphatase [Chloroflexota bacterium]
MNEQLLGHVPLFAALPPEEIRHLAATLRRVEFPPGIVLMHEGDHGDNCYVILTGQLEIVKALDTADERLLALRGPGDIVGEMSLLTGDSRRTASVRTHAPVALLELTRADFDTLLQRQPSIAYAMLRMLSTRLRDAHNATIQDLQEKNRQLTHAYMELQAAQARIVAEARERARLEQELHVAHLIQQQFLPRELPKLPGWQVAAYYRAAGAVGGDFYDFIQLPNGLMGIVVGDVTDKGVPAALVMATTHSILRGEAPRLQSPGEVLARTNELLFREIPPHMFVTCLYAILDPASGLIRVANAGHNLPYVRTDSVATEVWARGIPLGMLRDVTYEETEATLAPGASVLLYSDGLVEAHSPRREMFGFPHLRQIVASQPPGTTTMIERLLAELEQFTGAEWEQEDDVTLVTFQRAGSSG